MLKNVFTKYGLIRLGTSIVGKWYYLAAATGLVICWGLRDLFLNAIFLAVDGCKRFVAVLRGREHTISSKIQEDFEKHLFLFGMFLSFASAFMINALYKEGFYKVDDLINGRYVESCHLLYFTCRRFIIPKYPTKHCRMYQLILCPLQLVKRILAVRACHQISHQKCSPIP